MTQLDQKKLEQIPLEQITRSPNNRIIDEADPELHELAQSIREHGVLQPVLLQPSRAGGKGFELIAGERRWLASKIAGLVTVPALVLSTMSDVDAYQLTLIENLQRKNLSPLEEAEEYHKLLQTGSTPATIAAKIGKSVRYVYDRSRLLNLTAEASELLRSGKIEAGHAVLLARLDPKQQKAVIDDGRGGLFQGESFDLLPGEEKRNQGKYDGLKARTVRELQSWINDHVRFTEPDPMLFPETAATLAQAKEEKLKVISITHDHFVQPEAKDGTRIFGPSSWKRADGLAGSKLCDRSAIGVVVAGPGRGDAFAVCTNKKLCLVHWGKEIKERESAEKKKATGKPKAEERWEKEQREREAEQAKRKERMAAFARSADKITAELADRVKKAPAKAGSFLVDGILLPQIFHGQPKKAAALVPPGKTPEDALRFLAFAIIHSAIDRAWDAFEVVPKIAKALGVDVAKIIAATEAEIAVAAAKKAGAAPANTDSAAKVKKPAAKKAAKSKKK